MSCLTAHGASLCVLGRGGSVGGKGERGPCAVAFPATTPTLKPAAAPIPAGYSKEALPTLNMMLLTSSY